ncbi:hypothetical protein D3C76_979630 [compost metagenome]
MRDFGTAQTHFMGHADFVGFQVPLIERREQFAHTFHAGHAGTPKDFQRYQ